MDFRGEGIDERLVFQGIFGCKVDLHRNVRRPRGPSEVADQQGRVNQDRSFGSRAGGGKQLSASAAIGKAGVDEILRQMLDCRGGSIEQVVESELLNFADGIVAIAKDFAVIKIGRVNEMSRSAQLGSKVQDRGPESIRGMVNDNLVHEFAFPAIAAVARRGSSRIVPEFQGA